MSIALDGREATERPPYPAELLEVVRVVVVAGVPLGVLVAGVGGRLAMLLLRLTSPDLVRGTLTDDGFVVGELTLTGTYSLLALGAGVGAIGAAAYLVVAPWLVGPRWLRATTVGATAGVLVGSMIVHADGIDFAVLEPRWLAVGLFVALPALFGVLLVPTVEAVARPGSWTRHGEARPWVLPVLAVAAVPTALLVVAALAVVVAVALPLRRALLEPLRRSTVATLVVRAGFLVIPLLAVVALGRDLDALGLLSGP